MDQTLKTNCLKESRNSHTCIYNRLKYSDSVESDINTCTMEEIKKLDESPKMVEVVLIILLLFIFKDFLADFKLGPGAHGF